MYTNCMEDLRARTPDTRYINEALQPFEDIHVSRGPQLQYQLGRAGLAPYDAQDVVQDTFLRLMTKSLSEPQRTQSFTSSGYIARTAQTISIDGYRWKQTHPTVRLEDLGDTLPAAHSETALSEVAVQHVFARLSACGLSQEHQQVLQMRYEGFGSTDIAKVLGIAVSTAKSRLHRAQAQAQAILGSPSDIF